MLKSIHGTDIIVLSSYAFGSDEVRTSELMAKMANGNRVYFFSTPIIGMTKKPTFYYNKESHKVTVVQPYLPADAAPGALIKLMQEFIHDEHINHLTIWTDTAAAKPFVLAINPTVCVYDIQSHIDRELYQRSDVLLDLTMSKDLLLSEIETMNAPEEQHPYLGDLLSPGTVHLSLSSNFVISRYQQQ